MFRHARAYVVNADDSLYVENRLSRLMPNLEDLEVRLAKICRTELTVEVEGIAALDPS
jgi:hypothetical protein